MGADCREKYSITLLIIIIDPVASVHLRLGSADLFFIVAVPFCRKRRKSSAISVLDEVPKFITYKNNYCSSHILLHWNGTEYMQN